MPSLKALLLSTIFVSVSLAATPTETADECPQDWYQNTYRGDAKCCFGHMMIEDTDASCCVHYGHEPVVTDWSMAGLCFEKIPFTASDYSGLVSSASKEAATATATAPAATTTEPSTSEAASMTDSTSDSASDTGSETSTPTTNAGMPVATAEGMVLGGAAVAAALFAL